MRVLIDFTQIPLNRTGVGVYAVALVENMARLLSSTDELTIVAQSDDDGIRTLCGNQSNIYLVRIPSVIFRNRLLLMLFEQTILPVLAWSRGAELIHSLHYTHPLIAFTRRAVTIHDLTFVLYPEMHTRGRRWVMPFFIRQAMRHADAVIFVSEATKMDADRMFPGGKNLRYVAPLGVYTGSAEREEIDRSEQALTAMELSKPYLLFLGTLEPRKNIVRIVHAFERIAAEHPELRLVLAGKLGWHTEEIVTAIENSPMRSRIRHLGYVSESQKAILLHECEILIYPSLYEGFGLPVLEGMAAGAPVITSNLSSMPEVAGDAAVLVDPNSVDEIATAIQRILSEAGLAKSLREAGRTQAQVFTWRKTAENTNNIYRAVASKNRLRNT